MSTGLPHLAKLSGVAKVYSSICSIVMSKWQCCIVWTLESVCESVDNNLGRKKVLLANFVQHDFHSQKRVSIVGWSCVSDMFDNL